MVWNGGEFYTTSTLAQLAGVTPDRIRQILGEGQIPGARKVGRDWMIPKKAADQWLRDRTCKK